MLVGVLISLLVGMLIRLLERIPRKGCSKGFLVRMSS